MRVLRERLRVAHIFAKMYENRFKWFEHVRKLTNAPIRRVKRLMKREVMVDLRKRERSKIGIT